MCPWGIMNKLFLVLLFLSCSALAANDIGADDNVSVAQALQYAWDQIDGIEPASARPLLFRSFIDYARQQLPDVSPSDRRDIQSLIIRARAQISSQRNNDLIRSLFQPNQMQKIDQRALGG
jgi:hypothetical protein